MEKISKKFYPNQHIKIQDTKLNFKIAQKQEQNSEIKKKIKIKNVKNYL